MCTSLVCLSILICLHVRECDLNDAYLHCQSRVCYSESPVACLNGRTSLPCHTARPNYKEHAGVCVCVFVRAGLGAYSPTCHCGKVLLGLISLIRVCPVQVKTVDPSVWVGWVKSTETDSGDVQRQELNRCSLGECCEVKPGCQSKPFWLSPDKRFNSLHTIQAFRRGNSQPVLLVPSVKWKEKTNLC